MDLKLTDKRVLISGSSRGIGLAIAEGFLAERARVILTGRKPDELQNLKARLSAKHPPRNIYVFPCDFTKVRDIDALKRKLLKVCGGLDILIANVGSGKSKAAPITPKLHFQKVLDINFTSAVDATRAFYPLLQKSRGAILFISSIAGMEATGAAVDYAAAKTALMSFAKNFARKVARKGVRANCLAPGNVYFKGGRWEEISAREPERVRRMLDFDVPMGRFGTPEEIAAAAVFLCSPRASFITGAVLTVDGGQTVSLF